MIPSGFGLDGAAKAPLGYRRIVAAIAGHMVDLLAVVVATCGDGSLDRRSRWAINALRRNTQLGRCRLGGGIQYFGWFGSEIRHRCWCWYDIWLAGRTRHKRRRCGRRERRLCDEWRRRWDDPPNRALKRADERPIA